MAEEQQEQEPYHEEHKNHLQWHSHQIPNRRKDLGLSCMLNTEVSTVLAVIRRNVDLNAHQFSPSDEHFDNLAMSSLKSLRSLIFNLQQEWRMIDPSVYLSPFLAVIQSDEVSASATGAALSAILKVLKLEVFDEGTPRAKEAIQSVVMGITNCRLEKTDLASEDVVLMKILQVLIAIMKHRASILLTDQAVCTLINTCFQVVQQSANKGNLLQRNARYTMHELIQVIFARLPEIDLSDENFSDLDIEDSEVLASNNPGYGATCMVDIFHFLCSLLNVIEIVDSETVSPTNSDEDVQLFALVLINSSIELAGESIGKYKKLLRMIQDDLFHHLIHYGPRSSPLVLSMICSTVLNIYHFLRRSLRLQLEAFFSFVLLKIAVVGSSIQLQEVAVEGIISFCRQPTFIIEFYVNFDCDPLCHNVFEDIGKLLCRKAFPVNNTLSGMQIQAFEGLIAMVQNISYIIDEDKLNSNSSDPTMVACSIEISEYKPFWIEKCENSDDPELWLNFIRTRKLQKKKLSIAANHFNRDEKKGIEFLKHSHLVPDPPDPQSLAHFLRFTHGLDKTMIGEFLGDPNELYIQVLREFAATFEFSGVILDTALRTFLETFRLPGESQKIQRVLEAFAEQFYEQQSSEIFVDKDAVFVLCYSLIMLNTDQHNAQVKKKMTEEEFIRNNRCINGGKDLPREYLSELFNSISNKEITLFDKSDLAFSDMNPNGWINLIKQSATVEPFITCNFEQQRLTKELFATIAGPLVATLTAIFEHSEEDDILHECIETFISIAKIVRHGLEDVLDEIISSLCKFTAMLNPYASPEETLYTFSHDLKPRMATVGVFTIANKFGDSIRGGWRNIIDCLLKLKRLKLLPQSVIEPLEFGSVIDPLTHTKSESGVIFPNFLNSSSSSGLCNTGRRISSLMGRFSLLSLENGDEATTPGVNELERNLQIINQCKVGDIFNNSNLQEESLQNLGRTLIFAAGGKGQKFSTPIEEDETVGFCWELLVTITTTNLQRFSSFWPGFHDHLIAVAQFPLFSPCPFAEKAINSLLRICLKLIPLSDKLFEELIFKSLNLIWKLDKEVLDACCESITNIITRILKQFAGKIQSQHGWKTILHMLTITARHPETFEQGVEALISLMTDGTNVTRSNYTYCIESTFGFAALKISPVEKSLKLIDLMADSVSYLINWYKEGYSDPGSNMSNASSSSFEEGSKTTGVSIINMFSKLAEALRKTSLVRREEIRNHAIAALQRSFLMVDELGFTPSTCVNCINLIIFAMIDDLHEKMIEYSRRENSEREMKSMEGTLKVAMELLSEVFLQFLKMISQYPGFKIFWFGVLRRMGTCMKADLGGTEETDLQRLIPEILKKIITTMKEKEILVQSDGDELWENTKIQIMWIAPSVKDELFPEDEF